MRIAITREVSPAMADCELTHMSRQQIDVETARQQHRAYENCLTRLNVHLLRLPAAPEFPDSVFVEDVAVVLDEVAIITRPGAASRQGETAPMARVLAPYRKLFMLEAPATLDGGDVLCLDKKIYVGQSSRTNAEGIAQLKRIVSPHGYSVIGVPLTNCLHLKTAVSQIGPETLLVNPNWVDATLFDGWDIIHIDPDESFAANGLLIGDVAIYPMAYPKTRQRLVERGLRLEIVDLSELAKAEGAVTCCSIVFESEF